MLNNKNTDQSKPRKKDPFSKGFARGFEEGFLGFLYPFIPRQEKESSGKVIHVTQEKNAAIIIKTNVRRKTA